MGGEKMHHTNRLIIMRKQFVFLFFIVTSHLLAAGPLESLDAELRKAWPGNRAVNIVFHGHSVPAGYHVTPDVRPFESYPHLVHRELKRRYPHAVINVIVTAIGGENSASGAERFERDVLRHQPDLVLIDYALNDRRLSIAEAEAAWGSMIRACEEAGIPVVLLTPTGDSRADMSSADDPLRQRAELVRRLGREDGVMLGDVAAAWLGEIAAALRSPSC